MALAKASREWVRRCARRIAEVDPDIDSSEARELALRISEVERLSVMPPESAVDFITAQAASATPSRYERRAVAR